MRGSLNQKFLNHKSNTMPQENQFACDWFQSKGIKSWIVGDDVYIEVYAGGEVHQVMVSYSEVLHRCEL